MEFSIISKSKLEELSLRVDPEYYRPEFIKIEKKIKSREWKELSYFKKHIRSFGAYSLCNQIEYKESGIPFLRCQDIKDGYIDLTNCLFIDKPTSRLLWKSDVEPGTVLLTMSGSVGNAAIATEELPYPLNSNQDIAKIMLKANSGLNPYYLTTFLNSFYGQGQLEGYQ